MNHVLFKLCVTASFTMMSGSPSFAQPDERPPAKSKSGESTGETSLVARMMAFDANKDGKLSKSEVTDTRLHRLFDRADTDKDGVVTRQELTSLSAAIQKEEGERRDSGPGEFGPPGGFPPDGPGGPGGPPRGVGRNGFGRGGPPGMPRPGQMLDPFIRDRLHLSDDQIHQVDDLQKEIDAKLAKILTADQQRELKEMQRRGPGGPGDRPGSRPQPPRDDQP